jgi:hypothetical protein
MDKTEIETKAAGQEVGEAFDDFMRAFEAFKETNDERRATSSPASTARSTRTSASSTSWRSLPRGFLPPASPGGAVAAVRRPRRFRIPPELSET